MLALDAPKGVLEAAPIQAHIRARRAARGAPSAQVLGAERPGVNAQLQKGPLGAPVPIGCFGMVKSCGCGGSNTPTHGMPWGGNEAAYGRMWPVAGPGALKPIFIVAL